ncbi:acyltransferase [Burkholderia contaminans FFH2055]|uniref:acyltransferase family protein n=1 Tax=Burkholderia contaminans TaxID=488447 RepID=UPI0006253C44|nr:acyltransferase [Burkholderia contaminans]KKL38637.1 acyltransferase [Burkholderia contaminans FFH2055]MEB4631187.1 acyltransferase [Burkholderia contaminans]MEB4637965.1 acyltransferase [Burkholderia contaminans]MEB4653049.1 acyltransferase [Burkholderia contaminans]MEB4658085.1 acyltransferase [Burkholderia contaminans]
MASNSQNAFTFLRLLAAYAVIVTHSYAVLGRQHDWLEAHGFPQFSELGVSAFFAISGYLVCKSLQRNPNPIAYLRNRALRIFPGLAVLLLLTIFVAGPIVAHMWSPEWLKYLTNLSLYKLVPMLPHFFATNPVPVINGSLWTLPLEMTCYLMLLGVSWAGALNWRGMLLMLLGFYAAFMGNMLWADGAMLGMSTFQLARLGMFFWGGAFLATVALPRNWILWAASVLLALLPFYLFASSPNWKIKAYAFNLLLPFIVIFVAERLPKLAFLNRFDISYGVYIYAFLIQQMLVWHFGTGMDPTVLSLLTVVIVTPIAAASWFLIEKPALALKNGFAGARAKAARTA